MESQSAFVDAISNAAQGPDAAERVATKLAEFIADWGGPPPWVDGVESGAIDFIHNAEDLTIVHIVWPPHLITEPHNHSMWAAIGLYQGRENNILWRRNETSIEPCGAKTIAAGEACWFDENAIHSVHNPVDGLTGAIHVYGGDFLNANNVEWDQLTLTERPRSIVAQQARFAQS
jgi:predicted metal-dependent enzyme (double-stranded beta helix superfamily)